ncbi:MAG: hypothetical protein ABR964_11560 [Tepidisphaeraceae bacterium]|jgi:hypothetical protein
MILSLLLLVLTLVVAFYHYAQGLFSATISAILVVLATVVAVGYHETLASLLLGTKFTEEAASMALAALFAVVYIIPRLAFDYLIPGNVRFPALVDKIGAGAMGLVAGLLSTGVLAVAAQALPFGPDVGYYARYAVADRTGTVMGTSQQQDVTLYDVTHSPTLNPDDEDHLWLHQDDLVMALAHKVSDGGSLEGDQRLGCVHPDYLAELFGQRLGIQIGADRTMPMAALSVSNVYVVASPPAQATPDQPSPAPGPLTQIDGEPSSLRSPEEQVQPVLQPADPQQQALLVVRMGIIPSKNVADTDGLFRFSPGSIRLVAGRCDSSGVDVADYHPIAILNRKGIAVYCRIDDFLLASTNGARTIDLIFQVDKDRVFGAGAKDPPYHLVPGTFLEVKRYAMTELSGKKVVYGPPTSRDRESVVQKPQIAKAIADSPIQPLMGVATAAKPAPGSPLGTTALRFLDISISNKLFAPIDAHSANPSGTVQSSNLKGDWANRQWARLAVLRGTLSTALNSPGTNPIDQLSVNEGQVLVQIHCTVASLEDQRHLWDWGSRLSSYSLIDSEDKSYTIAGAWVHYVAKAQTSMVVTLRNLDSRGNLQPIPSQSGGNITEMEVWLAFEVPIGKTIAELDIGRNAALENLGFQAVPPPATRK